MRKIIVAEFISLDGVIKAPGPEEDSNDGPPAWIRAHRDPVSSAAVVQPLIKHDLVDTFSLTIIPVTLGGDKRLFAEGAIPAAFKVTESTVTSKGVIIVNYERAGAVPTGSR